MSAEQVTLRQLVEDPIYRQWLKTPPIGGFPQYTRFRVYVQRERGGPWAKKDFEDFKSAYNFLARHLREWHDAALATINHACRPPVIRVPGLVRKQVGKKTKLVQGFKRVYYAPMLTMDGHQWCPHCRRPSVFDFYSTHHAFTGHFKPLPHKRRCGVCGIAETAIKDYTKALK